MSQAPPPEGFDPDVTYRDVRSENPSVAIGPYHLLQCVGQGGMGEVWLAEQKHPVRRRVALKLIKAGMNTREVVSRFESERQALALMDHPAIAKIFDAGSTQDGLPYFVMEYVPGVPITTYCDRHRLTMDERLALFIQVCEGVQHAHQKAVIHRDLKPSNILVTEVDGRAVPKIIDFGVAKATSQRLSADTMFTRAGALIGTPEYMSPEQADSGGEDIDTRSDVYSLGVVFYELLVGALPLDFTEVRNHAFLELLRRIREEDAPRPSTKLKTSGEHSSVAARNRRTEPVDLSRQLKGDLDSIALKALEKDRGRRYSSASDFGADIQRYLQHAPVLAVAPSLAYRTRKFVRRHRFAVAASAAIALAVIASVVLLIVSSARIARERDRADREAQAAKRVSDFLVGAFAISDPNDARGNKVTAREVLDNGARKVQTDLAKEPLMQARLLFTIANVYEGLGLYESARQLVARAASLQTQYLGADHRDTLASRRLLGRLLEYQAHYGEAEAIDRDTLQRQQRVFGPDHIETIRTEEALGQLYAETGRYADAERLLSKTATTAERVTGRDSTETLKALHGLALAYDGTRQYAKEEALWQDLYERRAQKLGTDHPDTLDSQLNLAYVMFRRGQYPEAEKLQRQGLATARRLYGDDHPTVLATLGNLANTLTQEGRAKEAERLQREVLERRRRVLGPDHPDTQFAIANLALSIQTQKRYREAETLFRQALDGEIRALGSKHPEIACAWYNLATVEAAQGKRTEALADLRQAISHGYDDSDEIGKDDGWTGLRGDAGYKDALLDMKRQASLHK